MNLNIYGQSGANNIQELESNLKSQLDKLNQLKLMTQNVPNQVSQPPVVQPPQVPNNPIQPQRYCIDCGIKEDWDEFLKLNYNITEKQIFDDYKLFLQAKQEIVNEQGRSKLESMKERIKNSKVGGIGNINTNVQPTTQQPVQPIQSVQPTGQPMQSGVYAIGDSNNVNNGGIIQPSNGLLPTMQKMGNKQKGKK